MTEFTDSSVTTPMSCGLYKPRSAVLDRDVLGRLKQILTELALWANLVPLGTRPKEGGRYRCAASLQGSLFHGREPPLY